MDYDRESITILLILIIFSLLSQTFPQFLKFMYLKYTLFVYLLNQTLRALNTRTKVFY